jgi:ABC-type dipeptide/oligopeptide/nickel transport system permease component
MGLLNYIIRRLILMILVLIGVSLLVFAIMMLIPPGQRVGIYVHGEKVSPAQMEALIEKYGLRDPFPVQYARWMRNIFRGDFGFSVTASAPVLEGFKRYFPITFELVLYATPMIILVGVWLGTAGAVHKDKPIDHGTRVFAIFGYSLPTFWLGLLLLMVLYGYFGVFPPGVVSNEGKDLLFNPEFRRYTGLITIDAILNWEWGLFWDGLYHIILPAVNLVILNSALILRLMRSSMLEALGQDYIRTAIAKGASTRAVINLHARRNALIPVITISGYMFAILMAGMVITETIFVREGIGRWMARAALQLDVPAIMFNVLFLGTVFVTVNLIVDIVYAYVDPRIRLN